MAQVQLPQAEFKLAIGSGIQIHLQKNYDDTNVILCKNMKKLHFTANEWEKILTKTNQIKIAKALLDNNIEIDQ